MILILISVRKRCVKLLPPMRGQEKRNIFQEKADRERLMKICRASSSMPMITPMVDVDGGFYVDGGVSIRYLWAMR